MALIQGTHTGLFSAFNDAFFSAFNYVYCSVLTALRRLFLYV